MSNLAIQEINTEFINTEYDFKRVVREYVDTIQEFSLPREQKYKKCKELLEYMAIDNYWLRNDKFKSFVKAVKLKLKELNRENPEYKFYFQNIEERFHFARYCKGTTKNNLPCSINTKKRSKLCYIHEKKYISILNCVLEVIFVKDLAAMITDKCI